MNNNVEQKTEVKDEVLNKLIIKGGDLTTFTPQEKISHVIQVSNHLGISPYTNPFDILELRGKDGKVRQVLYANKCCTDQLRRAHNVSIKIAERELTEDIYIVCAQATMPNGRSDESIGAVPLEGKTKEGKPYKLQGEQKANKIMHAETKAKRRATLSIVGLGMLDESEVQDIKGARAYSFDIETGEILEKKDSNSKHEFIPKNQSPININSDKMDKIAAQLIESHETDNLLEAHDIIMALSDDEKRALKSKVSQETLEWLKMISKNGPNNSENKENKDG